MIKIINKTLIFIQLMLLTLEFIICHTPSMPFDIGVFFKSPIFYDIQCIIKIFNVLIIALFINIIYFFVYRKRENYVKVSKYVLVNFLIFVLSWGVMIF